MLPVPWTQFTHGDTVRQESGYEIDTLDYLWEGYGVLFSFFYFYCLLASFFFMFYHLVFTLSLAHTLPRILRKPEYFFLAFKYIHTYPPHPLSKSSLGVSSTTLHNKVLPTLSCLAQNLNEIHWEDRLNEYNHTPDFPYYVTGMVDTIPIYVLSPQNATLNHWSIPSMEEQFIRHKLLQISLVV